jgi:predicted metal-dependent phosphoesterase TrpH
MFADLHLHTRHSDGTYSPEDLAAAAAEHGLAVVALTDHDTMEGCDATAEAAGRLGIGFIAGAELTAEVAGRELHILGYFMAQGDLARAMERAQRIRQERIHEMVANLNALGVGLQAEAVFELARCKSPGRPHVARALVEGGFCSSLDEAFERYLKKDRPGWAPKAKIPADEAISLIQGAGGLAVLAHPGLNRDDAVVDKLVEFGLDGIECFHPKHNAAATEKYLALARRMGLLVTGGSDCHGRSKNRPTMGSVKLPMEHVEALFKRRFADAAGRERAQAGGASSSPPASEAAPAPTASL